MIELLNIDCMEYMATQEDNAFDLAIVDPPYGINENSNRTNKAKGQSVKRTIYNETLWKQDKPNKKYFNELMRVSKNQIIWGGNYFIEHLSNARCFIVWNKEMQSSPFADCELAWTSFENKSVKMFTFAWNGMIQGNMKDKEHRIHPTQKPVALYRWLLENYAQKGQRILDTHGGSFSSAIAAHYFGCDMVICEIDKDYFEAGKERFERETKQIAMF